MIVNAQTIGVNEQRIIWHEIERTDLRVGKGMT